MLFCQNLPALASASLFDPFLKQGKDCARQSKYVEAEKLLEMALQNSEHLKPDSAQMLDLYDSLAQAYTITGKLSKAEEYLKKVLQIRESSKKRDDLHMFATIMSLGTVYRRQDKFLDSEMLYKKGLAMFEGKGPVKAICQATVLFALGSLYLDMNRPQEAESLLKQALEVRKKSFLKKAIPEHTIEDSLGRAYFDLGKLEEADKILTEALAQARKANDQRSIAFSACNLSAVLSERSDFEQAGKLLDEAAKIMEKTDGPDSNNMATVFSRQANLAIRQDKYNQAEALLAKAITLHKKNIGARSTQVAFDQGNLVDVLRNQGKYEQAEKLARDCMSIFTDIYGKDSTLTALAMSRLAWVYADQGKYAEAEPISMDALRIVRQAAGADARELPSMLSQLGFIEKGLQKYQQAEELLNEAAHSMETSSMPNVSLLGYIYSELASLYRTNKDNAKCAAALNKAIAFRQKVYGPDHQRLLADFQLLCKLQEESGESQAALQTRSKIDLILAKHPELKATKAAKTDTIGDASNKAARPVKDKWALVVGISNFSNSDINLKFAAKDATDFANFLIKDANFSPDHVKLLTDQAAGRDNIIKQLGDGWLGRRAAADDLVVVYISSHGSAAKNEAGGVNFLVAHDTEPDALLSTGIPMQWLSQIIKEQVHAGRVVLILDVCHSGASSGGAKGLVRENSFDPGKLAIGEGQAIICSSAPEQISWESKNYPNSVFTRRLIEGLKQKNGSADLNSAFDYLKEQVEAEVLRDRGRLQSPMLFSKSWQGAPPVLSIETALQKQTKEGRK